MKTKTGLILPHAPEHEFTSNRSQGRMIKIIPLVDYRAQMVVAYRHYLDKNYTLALATYRRILTHYPADATALSGEAWSLYYLGEEDRAAADFRTPPARQHRRLLGTPGARSLRKARRRVTTTGALMPTILDTLLLNEHGIAFDPVSGEIYQLVGPAVPLVKLLQKGADNDALLQFLLDEYNVDEPTARRDLATFLHSLEQMKLWATQKPSPLS